MTQVASFVFSPFQENTYLVYDDTRDCAIVDPGCYDANERKRLAKFIKDEGLRPVRLLNTHAHLDHVFGNQFVHETYGLLPELHAGELPVLRYAPQAADMYGLHMAPSPEPGRFIAEGERIRFGETELLALLTPGHSPASLSFFCAAAGFVLSGDVLFFHSIGRTDLPGGDLDTLLRSIREQLFPLGDAVRVYNGHGQPTSIGHERQHNPFLA